MQKGQAQVLILAGIVLLLALAGGIFYLGRISAPKTTKTPVVTYSPQPSPTPTDANREPNGSAETANWKTYTNTKYGFTLEYPNDWQVKSENENVDSVTTKTALQSSDLTTKEINTPGIGGEQVTNGSKLEISVSNNENFNSYEQLKDFMENMYTGFPLNYFTDSKEVIVNGVKATLKSGGKSTTLDLGNSFCYFFNNGITYELTFTSANDDKLFDQILSTFKFLP